MTYDILVYGPLFCDLIFTDLPDMPTLGTELFAGDFTVTVGGSAIVAAGLQKLGANVGFIADLGNDPVSGLARQVLDDMNIDRTLIREHPHPLPQVTVALSFPQDRAFITRFERPKQPHDLAAILDNHSAKHLHISSFLAALDTPNAPQLAHDAGLTVSFDPGWDEDALRDPRLHALIRELDVFLPNEAEICYLMDEDDSDAALQQVTDTMSDGLVALKQGRRGATVLTTDGDRVTVPALSLNPIDTTGAGDSFDAGFLFQYIQDAPLIDCLRYGSVCGGLSTTKVGGAAAAPTQQEVETWLSKLQS